MQTVQYILQKLKVRLQWSNASYMCLRGLYFGFQRLVLELPNSAQHFLFFEAGDKVVILGPLGVSWKPNLDFFLGARWWYPDAQN